jgi:predicted phosphodiesterase
MRTILISDDDLLVGKLQADRCDVLICLGDLWEQTIARAVALYKPNHALGVRGNHDRPGPFPPPFRDVHLEVAEIEGIRFGGFNGSWKYKPVGHHLHQQEEVSMMLEGFPAVDVFVAHNSPRGVHEKDDDVHQGFLAFRDYIERVQPRYFLHGHQHVDQISVLGETKVVGVYGEKALDLDIPGT